jgi:hypothetical protein
MRRKRACYTVTGVASGKLRIIAAFQPRSRNCRSRFEIWLVAFARIRARLQARRRAAYQETALAAVFAMRRRLDRA